MPITIRDATQTDAALILRFIHELAVYEKLEHEVVATESLLAQNLLSPNASSHALILEHAGSPIGFAVYFYNFSTFLGQKGIYLEDVYVTPESRGLGAGKAVFQHLAATASRKNCGRLEWSVLDWNEPAIQFYEKLGAIPMEGWTIYRAQGDTIKALATQTLAESA